MVLCIYPCGSWALELERSPNKSPSCHPLVPFMESMSFEINICNNTKQNVYGHQFSKQITKTSDSSTASYQSWGKLWHILLVMKLWDTCWDTMWLLVLYHKTSSYMMRWKFRIPRMANYTNWCYQTLPQSTITCRVIFIFLIVKNYSFSWKLYFWISPLGVTNIINPGWIQKSSLEQTLQWPVFTTLKVWIMKSKI